MNREEALELTRRWTEAVATGDDSAWDAVLAPDVKDVSTGVAQLGSTTFRQRTKAVRSAFDRVAVRVEDVFVDGDRIAWRWRFEGVHTGAFAGVEPTHKPVAFCGVNLQTVKDGRVVEHWTLADVAGALRQLRPVG